MDENPMEVDPDAQHTSDDESFDFVDHDSVDTISEQEVQDMDNIENEIEEGEEGVGEPLVENDIALATEDDQDTTAEQYKQGKDIQGIPWHRLQVDRNSYRVTRLETYRNYTNLLEEEGASYREIVAPDTTHTTSGAEFYEFSRNNRSVHSTIVHFQLRNLIWATSPNDVYLVHSSRLQHWSPRTRINSPVADFMWHPGPRRRDDLRVYGVGRVQVSTLCISHGLIAVGGFAGELIVSRQDTESAGTSSQPSSSTFTGAPAALGKLLFSGRLTRSDNGITNALEIFDDAAHGPRVMASNNDCLVRVCDPDPFTTVSRFAFPWAVNYATVRPHSSLMAVVGDDPVTQLVDMHSGKVAMKLRGHHDYSFAAAWHPSGNLLATGNQDTLTLLWDVRSPLAPLACLPGRMGAIRALRFSPDGKYLAATEPADFVHLYEVASVCRGRGRRQEIDFFGEISGMSFSPCGSRLFIGISDLTYASLMVLDRKPEEQSVELFYKEVKQ